MVRAMKPASDTSAKPFPVENKSAEPLADEAKTIDPETPEPIRVELIHHFNYDGKSRIPGELLDLDPRLARSLVGAKFAKYPA